MASAFALASGAHNVIHRFLLKGQGAIDVIAVRHPCGVIKASGFHVSFGRTMATKDKFVIITVNKREIGLQMHLDDEGKCHFIQREISIFVNEHFPLESTSKGQEITSRLFKEIDTVSCSLEQNSKFLDYFNSLKMVHLPSECLGLLGLQMGENSITFTLASRNNKGKVSKHSETTARVFLYGCNTRFVVSDIDGTITRSELLGMMLPKIGKDWSHLGIPEIFETLEKFGFHLVYLTARPISQAKTTKNYLKWVHQKGHRLPNGPMLCSPDQMVLCLKRELLKCSHLFKIDCLLDIQRAFGSKKCFWIGFGNQNSDFNAYLRTGFRVICILDRKSKGELTIDGQKAIDKGTLAIIKEKLVQMVPGLALN